MGVQAGSILQVQVRVWYMCSGQATAAGHNDNEDKDVYLSDLYITMLSLLSCSVIVPFSMVVLALL